MTKPLKRPPKNPPKRLTDAHEEYLEAEQDYLAAKNRLMAATFALRCKQDDTGWQLEPSHDLAKLFYLLVKQAP